MDIETVEVETVASAKPKKNTLDAETKFKLQMQLSNNKDGFAKLTLLEILSKIREELPKVGENNLVTALKVVGITPKKANRVKKVASLKERVEKLESEILTIRLELAKQAGDNK